MSDEENQVNGSEVVSEETPTPQFTSPSSASVPSDVEAIVAKAIEKLRPEIQKEFQSFKDKRLSKVDELERKVAAFTAEELHDMGVNIPREAILEKRLQALEQGSSLSTHGAGTPSADEAIASAKEILTEANIDLSDPEVVKLWQTKTYANTLAGHKDMLSDVARLAIKRGKSAGTTPAQEAAKPGPVSPKPTPDGLLAEYNNEMNAARGNRSAILALKQKYRDLGLDVEKVGFK